MNDQRHGAAGFSIIELLIALVIISILTMLATVLVANRTEKARTTAALHDMTELRNGLDHAALDTGYYYRLYVLDDVKGGDGVGWGVPGDRIDGIQDEQIVTGIRPAPSQIFIYPVNGNLLGLATANAMFQQLMTNETRFGWNGAYISVQLASDWTGTPLDPWGNPYLMFSGAGYMDESSGQMVQGLTRSFTLMFPGESTSRGLLTPSKFDRMTLVSLGPDGMVGLGNSPSTGIGQGDDLTLSW